MIKPRVFFDRAINEGDELQLTAAQAHHLFVVLRIKDGSPLEIVGKAGLFEGRVLSNDTALIKAGRFIVATKPLSRVSTVFFAITKGDHNDEVVEKCTELGVREVSLWSAERSVVRYDPHKLATKTDRFLKIATSAAEQSKRLTIPTVTIISFEQLIERVASSQRQSLMLSLESTAIPLHELSLTTPQCDLIVGPEGDFSPDEVSALSKLSPTKVSLGSTTLRSETAAIAGVAGINGRFGFI